MTDAPGAQDLAPGLMTELLTDEWGFFIRSARQLERFQSAFQAVEVHDSVPFGKLLVKVKHEIIRMNLSALEPQARRAPAVNAATLSRWLECGHDDAGRPVVALDTRNAFEVDRGRFTGALDWRLAKFSDFPQALLTHRDDLCGKTVVSYCTGGIRCEKAALFMRDAGVDPVYQLEGGILKYFEEVGGAHFAGECFVFDSRQALDSSLVPTQTMHGSLPYGRPIASPM